MSPVLHIFGSELPAFGAMLVLGFTIVHITLWWQSRRHGYSFSKLHTVTLVAFAGGSIGARLFEVLLVQRVFSLSGIGRISEGTFFYGFLIGLLLACTIYYKFFSSSDAWKELDLATPAWLVMQIAGRIGCFFAGCCYGTHTDLPWGVTYHAELSQAPHNVALHPTQLYEAAAITALLIYTLTRRSNAFAGYEFLRTIFLYSVARFILEFLRGDERGTLFGDALSTSQGISLVFAAAVLILLVRAGTASRSVSGPIQQPIQPNTTHKRRSL
jgi:phosphatidylglycerol:prolipoprotein diacylglycerol transferase